MKPIDTLHIVISDTHTGSNKALFLDRHWEGRNTTHTPLSNQVKIRKHFDNYAKQIREARKGKRVRLIINGDAIEGSRHDQNDLCTQDSQEMADIHIEIMQGFQKMIGWQRGDELYYVKGTESHTGDMEYYIGQQLNTQMNGNFYAFDFLELDTNGVKTWFVHQGPGAGKGANEGNGMRNWLRDIYMSSLKDCRPCPDIVCTGHVHEPTYTTFVTRSRMEFRTIHGIILPSWKSKDRYAYAKAAVSVNKIGGISQEIKADGTIAVPKFYVME